MASVDAAYWTALLVSAVGGGVVVTLAAPVARVARELDEHDLSTRRMNEDGRRWIDDRRFQLEREMFAQQNTLGHLTGSGAYINARQIAVEDAAHELRDRVRSVEQDHAVLVNQERWWHRRWLRAFRGKRPRAHLTFSRDAAAALEQWRAEHETWATSAGGATRTWRDNNLLDGPAS